MATFDFSEKLPFGEMFLVRSSEIEGRIDPLYYQTIHNFIFAKQKKYTVSKMVDCIDMQRGRFGHRPRNDPKLYGGDYPFIQTGDIVKASQNAGKITYSQTLNELGLKTSRLQTEKAVILTIAANIGDTAILDYPACYPDSLIALTPKSDDLRLEYINIYFKFIKSFLEDLAPQAAQKNINYQQLAPVPIVIPPLAVQDEIIRIYENALLARNSKQKQAQTLLTSINDYLLGELGITLPETDNSLNSRIFTVQMSEVGGGAFDPFTQFNKHYRIEGGKYPNERLDNIAFLQKGQSITSDVSASGAYSGYVWYHDYSIFASDCTVIFSKDENKLITEFLAEVLKVKQQEIYLLQKGAGQPHVYPNDLAKLNIPLPDKPTQQKIIAHIQAIKAQATALQAEAEQLLSQAKAEIEQMILGGAQ